MRAVADAGDALRRLSAMVDQIDAYLEAGAPYREIAIPRRGGGTEPGTMFIGLMLDLVGVVRAARSLSPSEGAEMASDLAALEAARARRAYGQVLLRELRGQMEASRWFVDERVGGDGGSYDADPTEARRLSRIRQLLAEAEQIGLDVRADRDQAEALDRQVRGLVARTRRGPSVDPGRGSDLDGT
jgi:hypothetical protein